MQSRGKPRHLAAYGVTMDRTSGFGEDADGLAQLGLGLCSISAGYRLDGLLDRGAHAAFDGTVALAAFKILPMAFLGRRMMRNMGHRLF